MMKFTYIEYIMLLYLYEYTLFYCILCIPVELQLQSRLQIKESENSSLTETVS